LAGNSTDKNTTAAVVDIDSFLHAAGRMSNPTQSPGGADILVCRGRLSGPFLAPEAARSPVARVACKIPPLCLSGNPDTHKIYCMRPAGVHAELFLNDQRVGNVLVKGEDNSWHFGEFQPDPEFAYFAPLFGRWSLLMHADEDADRLTDAASEELREIEMEIDRLRAKLRIIETDEWKDLQQLNIDGELIDWKT
jgi:hypothetical protein